MAGSNSADERDGLQVRTAANVVTKQLRIADKGLSSIPCIGSGRGAKNPHYNKTVCLKILRLIVYYAALFGSYGRFGTACRYRLQRSSSPRKPLKMGPVGCAETSVANY